jgi:CRISPR-associated endonuclease Csn1
MLVKKVLGLDLGTNSIGWALIEEGEQNSRILGLGSRIVPMDSTMLIDFEKGKPTTKNVTRRQARGARRLLQRYKLRRSKLINTLAILGWMPKFESVNDMHAFLTSSPTNSGSDMSQFELYELRDRGLREILSVQELARVLYQFNQRRGFLSNRKVQDDEEENSQSVDDNSQNEEGIKVGTVKSYEEVEIVSIEEDDSGKKKMYNITLGDGRIGAAFVPIPFQTGKKVELLITLKSSKKWGESYFFQLPKKMDWSYRKHHINHIIDSSGLTIGQFYFRELSKNPHFRTKDNIILRERYIEEFDAIWNKQVELRGKNGTLHELERKDLLSTIAENLYKNNLDRKNVLVKKGLCYILRDDIIYYQRPLKSQKDSISFCRFEPSKKVIPISHPLYQEFRILDLINNFRIYNLKDEDCTSKFLTDDLKEKILEKLNSQKAVKPSVIKGLIIPKVLHNEFRLSHDDDKRDLRGNDTLVDIALALAGEENSSTIINSSEKIEKIWHILYSLDKTKDVIHALTRPKNELCISLEAAKKLSNISYSSNYGALSARAIRRLLPIMRFGNTWSESLVDAQIDTKNRIESIINGEVDDAITNRIREFANNEGLKAISDFRSIPYWAAVHVIYGSHSASTNNIRWNEPSKIELLPKNYLRNPIVQQMVNETLQVVKDIWLQYGKPDEIRIELARELKNSAKERESISTAQYNNKQLNESIKRKLQELGRPITDADRYRIWVESADITKADGEKDFENYMKYLKPDGKWNPAAGDITKYKLWEEQLHISPYTGKPIPLSRLFSEAYQIDHIIPRQRFYDDSLSNKVVVESHINADKGTPGRNLMAYEYIIEGPVKSEIEILKEDEFVSVVNRIFKGSKRKKLLLKEVPKDFVLRQLKDTQYITRAIREELAKITGVENVHTTTGGITDHLREQWGIAHLFKELLLPRFESLEQKLAEKEPTVRIIERVFDPNRKKNLLKLQGYSKRLDHRHHAADALIIACTKPVHIKRLNDLNKAYQNMGGSSKEAIQQSMNVKRKGGSWSFDLPWPSFIEDARNELESCVVSIKNRNRLLTKGVNKYIKIDKDTGKKIEIQQTRGSIQSARGALHNPQPFGEIQLHEKVGLSESLKKYSELLKSKTDPTLIQSKFKHQWQYEIISNLFSSNCGDLKKVNAQLKNQPLLWKGKELKEITLYVSRYTKRVGLTQLTAEKLENIASKELKEALKEHLKVYGGNDFKKAFSGDGIMAFNQGRKVPVSGVKYIDGPGQSIGDSLGKQQLIRKNSYNEKLHINTAGNFAFAIYENEEDVRSGIWPVRRDFSIVSFYDALQLTLNGQPLFETKIGYRMFPLSTNDLVYIPNEDEHPRTIDWDDKLKIKQRLFNMTKASGRRVHFTPNSIAEVVLNDIELGKGNCLEIFEGSALRLKCIKVKSDRLGNVSPVLSYD